MVRGDRDWWARGISIVSLTLSVIVAYLAWFPRPELLIHSVVMPEVLSAEHPPGRTLRFALVNSGNRSVLVESGRLAAAEDAGTEWTIRLDMAPAMGPVLIAPQEIKLVSVSIPDEFTTDAFERQFGHWIGLDVTVIAPSGKEYVSQFPVALYNVPLPAGAFGRSVFCPQHLSLLQGVHVMPSHTNACRSSR